MIKNLAKKIAVTTVGTAALTLGLMQVTTTEAKAASISYNSNISLEETDWDKFLSVKKFNSNLGTLNSVSFTLGGSAEGSIGVENKNTTKTANVNANLASTIQVNGTIGGTDTLLVEVIPSELQKFTLAKFDGAIDFAGTSGKTVNLSTAKAEKTESYTDADILNAFIGSGNLAYTINAIGSSTATGSGNLATNFSNSAAANLTITYNYTEGPGVAVPAPPTAIGTFLAMGFVGMKITKKGLFSQKKI